MFAPIAAVWRTAAAVVALAGYALRSNGLMAHAPLRSRTVAPLSVATLFVAECLWRCRRHPEFLRVWVLRVLQAQRSAVAIDVWHAATPSARGRFAAGTRA